MLQIVKDGKTSFLGICRKCGCEFSYDLADLHTGQGTLYVQCPCCEYVYYHPDQDQDFTIFSPPYTDTTTITPYTNITVNTTELPPIDAVAAGPFNYSGEEVQSTYATFDSSVPRTIDFGDGITGKLTSIKSKPAKELSVVINQDGVLVPIKLTNAAVIKEIYNDAYTVVLKPNDMTCDSVFPPLKVGATFMIEDAHVSDYYISSINKEYNIVTLSKLNVTGVNLDEYN